jgi:maltose O-acetyltransferase
MIKFSEIINTLLFDYEDIAQEEIANLVSRLPLKMVRWLVTHHPDNMTRKLFLRLSNVTCGAESVINSGFILSDDYQPLLIIGSRVAISPNVTVICCSSPNNSELTERYGFIERYVKAGRVVIQDDAWIGTGSIVLPNVEIGKCSIVGAGSVVNSNVPPNVAVAGVPARIVSRLDE